MIVDSCVLIYFSRIGKLGLLKSYFKKIFITEEIAKELLIKGSGMVGASELSSGMDDWIEVKNVKRSTEKICEFEGIEKGDAELLLLAEEIKDSVLTNDKALILVGRAKGIECLWITTLILRMCAEKFISKREGKDLLRNLVSAGLTVNVEVYDAILREIERL